MTLIIKQNILPLVKFVSLGDYIVPVYRPYLVMG